MGEDSGDKFGDTFDDSWSQRHKASLESLNRRLGEQRRQREKFEEREEREKSARYAKWKFELLLEEHNTIYPIWVFLPQVLYTRWLANTDKTLNKTSVDERCETPTDEDTLKARLIGASTFKLGQWEGLTKVPSQNIIGRSCLFNGLSELEKKLDLKLGGFDTSKEVLLRYEWPECQDYPFALRMEECELEVEEKGPTGIFKSTQNAFMLISYTPLDKSLDFFNKRARFPLYYFLPTTYQSAFENVQVNQGRLITEVPTVLKHKSRTLPALTKTFQVRKSWTQPAPPPTPPRRRSFCSWLIGAIDDRERLENSQIARDFYVSIVPFESSTGVDTVKGGGQWIVQGRAIQVNSEAEEMGLLGANENFIAVPGSICIGSRMVATIGSFGGVVLPAMILVPRFSSGGTHTWRSSNEDWSVRRPLYDNDNPLIGTFHPCYYFLYDSFRDEDTTRRAFACLLGLDPASSSLKKAKLKNFERKPVPYKWVRNEPAACPGHCMAVKNYGSCIHGLVYWVETSSVARAILLYYPRDFMISRRLETFWLENEVRSCEGRVIVPVRDLLEARYR